MITELGYFLKWVWHYKGKNGGPIRVIVLLELGFSKKPKRQGNKIVVIVPYLLSLLPKPVISRYHVYLNNLFVSNILIRYLRLHRWAAISTYYKDSGIFKELIDLKTEDSKKDCLP